MIVSVPENTNVITCVLTYTIDPGRVAEFERYAQFWIDTLPRFGGRHHGYFLPSEGANDIAYALFSFPSLADYERYRKNAATDPKCRRIYNQAAREAFIQRHDRTFMRPMLPDEESNAMPIV